MGRKEGKEEDRQQGSFASSIGNIRVLLFSVGKTEGEGRERRGFFFFFIFPSFMEIFGIWKGIRGGKEGKEEDLMRTNPKRSRI